MAGTEQDEVGASRNKEAAIGYFRLTREQPGSWQECRGLTGWTQVHAGKIQDTCQSPDRNSETPLEISKREALIERTG